MKERQFDGDPSFNSDAGHFRPEDIFLAPGNDALIFAVPDGDVVSHVALQNHATTNVAGATSLPLVNSSTFVTGIDYHWDGITFAQSGGYYPPDNGLAANSSVVITAENDAIQFTSTTGSGAVTESLNTFFHSVVTSGYFLTDPRVLYDTFNHRFVVSVDEVSNTLKSSYILLAVSNTDLVAPSLSSSNWQFESASTTYNITSGGRTTTTWADQPLVSVDGHDIYVSTNQFSSRNETYTASVLSVFNDGLYNTNSKSSLVSASAYSGPSYQPASNATGGEYFVSDLHNALSIFKSTPTSSGVTNSTPQSVPLGTIDFGTGSYSASQLGTSYKLDAGDGRINSAAYDAASQKLYVVFEGQPSSTNSTPSVEWAQLDMSGFNISGGTTKPTVLHTGNLNSLLTGATAGAATFNGSVAVDARGDALFNFNVSGSQMSPADYYAVWTGAGGATASTTPAIAAPIDYHDSVASYVDPAKDPVGRWGDYSTAVADPAHANGFYVSNEFDNGTVISVTGIAYSSWGTAVAHVTV